MNLFYEENVQMAIERIKKFALLAEKMNLTISVGFSGGKDSQVVYDLCLKAGIQFKAYYNVCFESNITKKFIRKNYPSVIWRKEHKFGWVENIYKNHNGMLPTVEKAYCCKDYKHNPKYVDLCSILGVRREESFKRKKRGIVNIKNKSTLKKNKDINNYFSENCLSIGSQSLISLMPIVDWSSAEIWNYIYKNNIPINKEYEISYRVGCIICPKRNLTHNYNNLMKYPKLISVIIKAREKNPNNDWIISSENKDYKNFKVEYICRWLNYSFRPFTKKQQELCFKIVENYYNTIK